MKYQKRCKKKAQHERNTNRKTKYPKFTQFKVMKMSKLSNYRKNITAVDGQKGK